MVHFGGVCWNSLAYRLVRVFDSHTSIPFHFPTERLSWLAAADSLAPLLRDIPARIPAPPSRMFNDSAFPPPSPWPPPNATCATKTSKDGR